MSWIRGATAAVVIGLSSYACQLGDAVRSEATPEEGPMVNPSTVLGAAELEGELGPLIDVMSRHIPSMTVNSAGGCPSVSLRGANTAPGITEPTVYVDGLRTLDTCVLSGTSANDVKRVEVYANGFTSRPGYAGNSHGLILIFMRDR